MLVPVYYAALCGQFFALRFLFENGAEVRYYPAMRYYQKANNIMLIAGFIFN